jgi:glycosyltransferase involved in cell wall biosynthesis
MSAGPRVDVGLPVRNGERFLPRQLESLLAQDFRDFRIIISDNGSTDRTREICTGYAARDSRVHYHRSDSDLGLAWNHNRTFELARAPYFKWAAHDDEHEPTYLSRCVAVLDADASVVCCHSASVVIDEDGTELRRWPARTRIASPSTHVRLGEVLRPYPMSIVYGVMRADGLRQTGLHRPFPGSDHALLAELALLGRLVEIPEPLFRRRHHAGSSIRAFRTARSRRSYFTGQQGSRPSIPGWPLNREMVRIVHDSPARGRERVLCWLALARWMARKPPRLAVTGLERALTLAGREDAAAYVRRPRRLVSALARSRRNADHARRHAGSDPWV